jgi:AcrR family transcriptional regulator
VSGAKYHSERRHEQAEATRQAILDAARALFIERGYAGTTVADIAAAACVAVPTVYVSVGPKPAILGELRKMIPILARVPEDARARFELASDPRQVISGLVSGVRRLIETSGELMFAIESAAPFEPVAAEAWEEGLVIHRAACGMVLERLEALGALKEALPPARAGDVLSLLSLPATWRTLGAEYGWTYDEVEAWIVDTAIDLITESAR